MAPFGHGHGGAPTHRASSFFYETDAENRIVSLLEAGREGLKPHWYRYDAADRLLADDSRNWSDRRYSYDAADNRTSATSRTAKQTIVPNALNQMQTVNGQPTQYDAAGNLLEDEARQYDWDAEHRLIRIRYKAQAGKETRFGYDGLGRRTVITEVEGTGTTETHYVWCGEAICQKRDANGQLLRAYYPEGESGPEIGKRVAKADTATETDADGDEHDGRDQDGDDGKAAPQTESTGSLIYARNHLGSVTDTLTPDGRAVTHTEYGPYGELVKSQGQAEYRSDFGYGGMQYHAASGMYLTLFRAYDPGTGRWVSRDPMGEDGGINLYAYVGGNPVSLADPLGLDPKGSDPAPKRIPSDNQSVINWLCRFGGEGSPTTDLMNARGAGLDRNDDNLAAAERFAEMMDGNYSFYSPWRSDDLNFLQFLRKVMRDVAKNGEGNGSKDAGHVAKWGAQGAFNYEQGVSWTDWKRRNCNCGK
ncbi:RHS repeat-associated core domain-containing protein [Ralstonia solanacearum]|uniref:RHS repeat-associated core domain-containing protein n=1 Tax=Ralstonia solanacearum TaxID=305 RepID=UPI0002EAEFD7|nr:RHS repeat-associated core domain-containing protein [Ralstonia solanacearum]MCG3576872.1 hypothetical protein [Ralstonia solanacearum]MDC6300478.1 hypothetical protein [Ralstonia solanacearum]MDC6315203.1 hypothetical protein [Ralstonia solanacearum]